MWGERGQGRARDRASSPNTAVSEAVMVETDEAVTGALDLLHAEVEPFGRSVRGSRSMVGEDL
jgi:hypothetical protein